MKISTNWLKDFVVLSPPFEKIADELTLAGLEVKKVEPGPDRKDLIFEIEITTNRPDWLSHLGVAREIAAVRNLSFKMPAVDKTAGRPVPPGWKINLKEAEGCPYYTAVYMEGVQAAPTPDFIRDRLQACGLRSISLLVDITNYVLLEIGQPLHAFDADLIAGREVQIRRAKAGEKMQMISGSELTLAAQDLVIADSEKAVALAGIMGGKTSEVSERTRNIFLESAFFHPRWVRQSSRRLGIASDSSYRFERRVDPEGVDLGRDRAVALIQQYAKPRFISGVLRIGQKPQLAKTVLHISAVEIEKRLGVKIKPSQVASVWTRIGLEAKQDSAENWKVEVPSFRADITQTVDLVEEVARIYGFDNIPENLPNRSPLGTRPNPLFELSETTRDFLSGTGFYETVTFSLISGAGLSEENLKEAVWINNPQNQELCWMRPVLLPSLLGVLQKNQPLAGERVGIFEVANVYRQGRGGVPPAEERSLGIALLGGIKKKNWYEPEREIGFFDLKGALEVFLEHLGLREYSYAPVCKNFFQEACSLSLQVKGEPVGFLGEVHPQALKPWDLERAYFAEISLEKLLFHAGKGPLFEEFPRFPSLSRDLSVTVPGSVCASDLESEILGLGKGLLKRVELFDLFQGGRIPKGFKNLAFRLVYQSREQTLVSEDIQKLHTQIADVLVKKYQASFQ